MSQRGMKMNVQNESQLEKSESEALLQLRFLEKTAKPSNMR